MGYKELVEAIYGKKSEFENCFSDPDCIGALTSELDTALTKIPPREAFVLRMQFALIEEEPKTLNEIALLVLNLNTGEFGVHRERARQLGKQGLSKMRHPKQSRPVRQAVSNFK